MACAGRTSAYPKLRIPSQTSQLKKEDDSSSFASSRFLCWGVQMSILLCFSHINNHFSFESCASFSFYFLPVINAVGTSNHPLTRGKDVTLPPLPQD
uniref:Uncharacterized protein n=1 Tax=Cucumis melo TaxID=3656 RepID=A0A9I9EBL9_CUCME